VRHASSGKYRTAKIDAFLRLISRARWVTARPLSYAGNPPFSGFLTVVCAAAVVGRAVLVLRAAMRGGFLAKPSPQTFEAGRSNSRRQLPAQTRSSSRPSTYILHPDIDTHPHAHARRRPGGEKARAALYVHTHATNMKTPSREARSLVTGAQSTAKRFSSTAEAEIRRDRGTDEKTRSYLGHAFGEGMKNMFIRSQIPARSRWK
jgi:hypothetical protein